VTAKPWSVLQHVPFEGPGLIAAALHAAGRTVDVRHLHAGDAVPQPDEVGELGGLVVMGGPMGVAGDAGAADAEHPFLAAERTLLAAAVPAGLPVLGVCLGAQLLAAATGGEVTAGQAGKEIGLGIVDLTADGRRDPVLGPAGRVLPVLHWHGDTWSLPPGAAHLATSARYRQQAFRLGERVYGLQFHIEVDDEAASVMEPHLPAGVRLDRRHLALVRRAGAGILERFVAAATREGFALSG
jgi:GMP synthase (glutamine-hydrolysing)